MAVAQPRVHLDLCLGALAQLGVHQLCAQDGLDRDVPLRELVHRELDLRIG